MKNKELKNLATKIAKLEIQLKTASGKEAQSIENEIVKLTSHVDSIKDILALDDLILEILAKEEKKES